MTDRDTDYEDGAREGGDMWGPSSESPPLSPRSSSSHPSTLSPSCPAFFTSVCWRRTTTFFFIMIVTLLFLFVALETHLQIDNPCLLGRSGRWSIGMVHSKDKMPIDWRTSLLPVLSCTDVTDARNSYVADPFMLQRKEYDYGKDPLEMTSAAKGVMDEGEKALVRSVMKGPGNFESQAARLLTSPDASERTRNGKWFMFFEVLNTDTDEGDIGMAWSNDPITDGWHYQEIVLDEDYHLSYPFVFHWQGNYYMVPESHQNKSVRLYKASAADFPHKWTFVKTLLTGKPFIDPSPLFHNGVWYIFTYVKAKSSLLLYYSTSPNIEECEWRLHPASPLYTNNDKYARPGGRPFVYRMPVDEDGVADRILSRSSPNYGAATATSSGAFLKSDGRSKFEVEHAHKTPESRTEDVIIRFTQNDVEKYGHFLHMMRVKQLTPEKFEETEIFSIRPIPDFHWISQRTHHIDLHLITRYQDERNTLNVSTFSLSHHEADNNKELGGDPHIWMGVLDGNYHYNNLDQVKRLHYLGLFIAYVIVVLFFFPEMRHRLHRLSQHLTQTIRELLSRFDVYASSPSSPSKKSSKLPTTATATSSSTRNTSTSHPKPKYVRAHLPILLSRLLLGLLFILMLSPALYTFSSLTFTTRLPHPQRPLFVDTLSSSSATTRIAPPPALPSPPTASDSKQFVGVGPDAPPSSGVDSKVPCPITLVTALYDIGRGDPRMGQDKMQPWSNYLSYFSLVLQVNSCQVIHVDPTTVDFVVAQRGCRLQRTGGESAGDENGKGKGKGKGWRQERVENGFYENSYRVLVSDCTYPTEIIVTSLADMRAESQLLPKITVRLIFYLLLFHMSKI